MFCRDVDLTYFLSCVELDYWTSASMTKGILVNISKGITLSGKYRLQLTKVEDGLIHR